MAMVRADGGATPPAPTTGISDAQILALFEGAQGTKDGGADSPIVPLWVSRPVQPMANGFYPKRYGPGGPSSDTSPLSYVDEAFSKARYASKGAAEMAWLDMEDKDRRAFADRALAAGMWNPKDGAQGLIRAWSQAVDMASTYNASNDKAKWVSPWEAVDKLYAAYTAASGGTVMSPLDTGWRTDKTKTVQNFTEDSIRKTAEQILRQELGRGPTDAEVKAYTIAANQAAAANPQIVTTRTRNTAFDAQGNPISQETQRSVSGDPFDPSLTIEQQARGTEEAKAYAAQNYYNAAMQALGAIIN